MNRPAPFRTLALVAFLMAFGAASAFAQAEFKDDPLDKPEIWAKLKENPEQSVLWVDYIGKPFPKMTKEDKNNILLWKGRIKMQLMGEDEYGPENDPNYWANASGVEEANEEDEAEARRLARVQYLNALRDVITAKSARLDHYKQNINQNFELIEDYFAQSFVELDKKYVRYENAHPDGGKDKTEWVSEHEALLAQHKEAKFEELKADFLSQTGGDN